MKITHPVIHALNSAISISFCLYDASMHRISGSRATRSYTLLGKTACKYLD